MPDVLPLGRVCIGAAIDSQESIHDRSIMARSSQAVTIAEGGRIVIPARYRKELGLCVGDSVVVRVEDGELRIHSVMEGIRRAQARFAKYATPGPSMSDELLAERRLEAANE